MAPMRSHLYELFKTIKTGRKVNFWYGGRSRAELFYLEHFRSLEREYPNFKFHLVLSDALPEDNWTEKKGVDDTKKEIDTPVSEDVKDVTPKDDKEKV